MIHKNAVGKIDPHRLTPVRGPSTELDPHIDSCEFDELPGYAAKVRSLKKDPNFAVDLFSGAGGLSLGLHRANFDVILACDIRNDSIMTHRHHFGGCSYECDLSKRKVVNEIADKLNECGEISLIAGGPPCQPFSRNIKWRKHNEEVSAQHQELNEDRRELWESFISIVEQVKPKAFLMENVSDIAQGGEQEIFRSIINRAEKAGYRIDPKLIYAWQYGVPQLRPRLFISGTKINECAPMKWPKPTYNSVDKAVTLEDAISDLPPLEGGWNEKWDERYSYGGPITPYQTSMREWLEIDDDVIHDHLIRKVREDDLETFKLMRSTGVKYSQLSEAQRRYSVTSRAFREGKKVKENQKNSFGDKYNILKPNEPCLTITAHMSKDGYWYIHPQQNRTLSVREAARVQSFPDGFNFHGGPSNRFHQIGEAVAPIVAYELGKALIKSIKNKKDYMQADLVPQLRKNLISWYELNKKEVELIWTKKREGRKIIPNEVRAWNACLGILLPETFKKDHKDKKKKNVGESDKNLEGRKKETYRQLKKSWPNPESFLHDNIKMRTMKIKSFSLEKYIPSLELLAEDLNKDEIDWSEIARKDYGLFSRNSVRGALATVGLTTEIKQSLVITKIISKLMDLDYEKLKFSNMNREIHIGHLLEKDSEGTGYCSLLALSKQEDTDEIIQNKLKLLPKEQKIEAA
ncbi:DNA-cytosine methyltransferase [Prochlorococcus marinus str. MIT 9515]|uniref:Cytosine-specific methyltransferase n=1 Tax=Prochlorococcus marinus (strain MIT 9515) TaxID=167542 RepID=A2BV42_PROM5|nr:DNA cytosine methyltransferase [Prochlorococcus marinus]ABM71653.1 DNA-cytosine methyltransferase [Prochlorococcus marinus str. MIT 9515]